MGLLLEGQEGVPGPLLYPDVYEADGDAQDYLAHHDGDLDPPGEVGHEEGDDGGDEQ